MTKKEFLSELSKELEDLSKEERESALKYYEDYFDDAGVENEKEVIKELESPQKVAEVIKKENNSTKKRESHSRREPLPVWAIILLALFFVPVGIPLIIAFFSTIFGLFMGLIGVLFGLTVAGIAILASGIGVSVFGIIQLFISPIDGLLIVGIGSILTGIGLLFTWLMVKLTAVIIPPLIRGFVDLIRYPFRNRGE